MTRIPRRLALIASLLPCPAFAVDSAFTYQGLLSVSGVPAPGSAYDFQFTLQNGVGTTIGSPLLREDVPTIGGRFAVRLDFGRPAFDGTPRFLAIGVRPFDQTGAFTPLAPSVEVTSAPYALRAGDAEQALAVAPNAVGSSGIVNASVAAVDINENEIQRRFSPNFCTEGQAIRGASSTGALQCDPVRDTAGFVYGGATSTATPTQGISYATGTSVTLSVPSFRNVTVGFGGTVSTIASSSAVTCRIQLIVDGQNFNELSVATSGSAESHQFVQAPSRWISYPMTGGGSHTLSLSIERATGVGSTCSGSDFWIDVRSR